VITEIAVAAVENQPFERQLRGWTRRGVRLIVGSLKAWVRFFRRALKFLLIAALFALVEPRLLGAWRLQGLQVLRTYVPLMLFVYGRLLFDRRVRWPGKALFVTAILYGVVRTDLIPDRRLNRGLVDDIAVVAFAVWYFRYSCPASIVGEWANKAVAWHERVRALRRDERRSARGSDTAP
jgi:uncharacterized membrane protein YkvA (DUF1232 family)